MNARATRRSAYALFAVLACAAALAGCAGGGAAPSAFPSVAPTPTPSSTPIPKHLFVGYKTDSLASLSIAEFSLPLAVAAPPVAFVPSDGTRAAFAVDAARGVVAIAFLQGTGESIAFYDAPFQTGRSPFAIVAGGPATIPAPTQFPVLGMGFDPSGDLWIATSSDLREFVPPFLSYSLPAAIVSNGVAASALGNFTAQRPVFDPSGTMYVNDSAGATSTTGVFTFSAPYTTPPKRANPPVTLGPLAFDGNGNAVTSFAFASLPTPGPVGTPLPQYGMGVFPLPLGSQSTPSSVFPLPFPLPNGQTDDATSDGTSLYLANHRDGSIDAYTFPINATDLPTTRVPCPPAFTGCGTTLGSMQLQLAP